MPTQPSPALGTRPHNLALLLRLVHENGAQSRAALTEQTGLNRSTIADLVAELVRRGLVDERIPDVPGRVGRPSPVVTASARVVAIAVNPEVDAIEIAAIGLDRSIVLRERLPNETVPTPDAVVSTIADRIAAWREGALAAARIAAIGVAVPGLVRTSDGVVRNAPHLGWTDVPLADLVRSATASAAFVDNDATLGAIAEHRYGAGRGIDDVVYLNGGASGIGGGLIIHGRPVAGAGGYAGEFGQNRPRISADADRRTRDGVLEAEVSRRLLLDAVGLDSADDETLAAELSESDSPVVAAEITRQAHVLASALANAVNVLNPALVVLGGFLATLADLRADQIVDDVTALAMSESAEALEIRPAALGADRLLIGAAELAFADLLADPGERS
ncbi:transcriptional regulator [Microbacterium sp. 1.5R]|uniref:ROK family transcriptional regulator n=1 Tax=unclassified Microbacterium TaxID=2609290 RepID=UPI00069ECA9B|nr:MULTISPECIES: ROK family transcriptional regulator [unclassified Microbacterium]AKV87543.1 transcriptional regulator [Microbacterium sp. CGR1]APH44053.1 transcriptional regulator [Microbacterium sp. 1.5R]MBC6495252.1 transcriptional regulator [Microbacterium sp. 4-7]